METLRSAAVIGGLLFGWQYWDTFLVPIRRWPWLGPNGLAWHWGLFLALGVLGIVVATVLVYRRQPRWVLLVPPIVILAQHATSMLVGHDYYDWILIASSVLSYGIIGVFGRRGDDPPPLTWLLIIFAQVIAVEFMAQRPADHYYGYVLPAAALLLGLFDARLALAGMIVVLIQNLPYYGLDLHSQSGMPKYVVLGFVVIAAAVGVVRARRSTAL